MVDVTPYVEGMRWRMAEREERDREARRKAREVVARAVALLSQVPGVRRIYLYGSLAYRRFHERSDIDLAVAGARTKELDAVTRSIQDTSPFPMDIRPFEGFPAPLRKLITEYGEILYDRPCDASGPEEDSPITAPAMLRVLKAEIEADLSTLDDLEGELSPLLEQVGSAGVTQQELVHAGYLLHNVYNACESILRRIATAFENAVNPERWNKDLPRRMTLDIPDIRPAVIGDDVRSRLDELRRFRHFFRHNYAARLRAAGIAGVVDQYRTALPAFREAIGRFLDVVDAMIERSRQP